MPPSKQAALSQTVSQCHDRPLESDRAGGFKTGGFKPTDFKTVDLDARAAAESDSAVGLGRSTCDRLGSSHGSGARI
jgi:hypothetical protein